MRNGYFGWLLIGLLGGAAFSACIGPTEDNDPEDQGAGGTGGETTGTAGSGMGGADPGGCIEITSLTEIASLDLRLWETVAEPGFTSGAPDYIELYIPVEETTFSLPATIDDCYVPDEPGTGNPQICAIGYEDWTEESNGAFFAADSGSLTVESITDTYYVSGSVSDVTLVEININEESGAITAVPNGRCLHIANADFALEEPTPGWECDPGYYDETGQGFSEALCDCDCGAADPDCSNAANPVEGCEEPQTCGVTGECEGVPDAWTCADNLYDGGTGNGCDCNCGTADPDCEIMTETVVGCPASSQCPLGECLPAAWMCNPLFYGEGFDDSCDCGCGAQDLDCENAAVATCDYCGLPGSCSTGTCPGTIDPDENFTCTP